MAQLKLTLLGGFRARLDPGSSLVLPTRKAQALLAYLALPLGRAHPREKLAALLWGGIREPSARASLRQALFSIRRTLAGAERTLRQVHVLGSNGRLLATSIAVIAGITYNFLPFMVLPLYVSLEQIDGRLIEAAEDLYASRWKAFLRVTLPLSLPGVVAGTLLTFIPAAGDFINAQLLGSPTNHMIGNVIQSKFLELTDYPAAASMSFVLMAAIIVAVLAYARAVGTEQLTG